MTETGEWTDQQQTSYDHKSSPWAYSSGELKRNQKFIIKTTPLIMFPNTFVEKVNFEKKSADDNKSSMQRFIKLPIVKVSHSDKIMKGRTRHIQYCPPSFRVSLYKKEIWTSAKDLGTYHISDQQSLTTVIFCYVSSEGSEESALMCRHPSAFIARITKYGRR